MLVKLAYIMSLIWRYDNKKQKATNSLDLTYIDAFSIPEYRPTPHVISYAFTWPLQYKFQKCNTIFADSFRLLI